LQYSKDLNGADFSNLVNGDWPSGKKRHGKKKQRRQGGQGKNGDVVKPGIIPGSSSWSDEAKADDYDMMVIPDVLRSNRSVPTLFLRTVFL